VVVVPKTTKSVINLVAKNKQKRSQRKTNGKKTKKKRKKILPEERGFCFFFKKNLFVFLIKASPGENGL
jgi:hypothetical protein